MEFPCLVNQYDLGAHVRFPGFRPHDELMGLYDTYDVFAFPTWAREPFGVAPLEAASRGCVPIISKVCGVSEWLVDRVHCVKAERTAEAFARVFAQAIAGEIDLASISARAEAAAWRDFHVDVLIPRVESALIDAARTPRGNPGTAESAYRMAVLAEHLAQTIVQEPYCI
jgi:glycosyltransferase involved in cell wall biosynthesis